jgi:hypothetical protein
VRRPVPVGKSLNPSLDFVLSVDRLFRDTTQVNTAPEAPGLSARADGGTLDDALERLEPATMATRAELFRSIGRAPAKWRGAIQGAADSVDSLSTRRRPRRSWGERWSLSSGLERKRTAVFAVLAILALIIDVGGTFFWGHTFVEYRVVFVMTGLIVVMILLIQLGQLVLGKRSWELRYIARTLAEHSDNFAIAVSSGPQPV